MLGRRQLRKFTATWIATIAVLLFTQAFGAETVRVISNQATIQYQNGAGQTLQILSDQVNAFLPATIQYCTDGSFQQETFAYPLGGSLFVQTTAPAFNTDPTTIQQVTINITSSLTGDTENYTATETGPNTGIFQIRPFPQVFDARHYPPHKGNGVIEALPNDKLTARLEGTGNAVIISIALVDPGGVVFDSRLNTPVPNAIVTLVTAGTSNAVAVLNYDGHTPSPNPVTTGADGRFTFPLIPGGDYQLLVQVPPGYTFPSIVPPSSLPPGRLIDSNGSYGRSFHLSESLGSLFIDVPVDFKLGGGTSMFVEKTADKTEAEIGDFLTYSLKVINVTSNTIAKVTLSDGLPAGFSYVKGTAKLDTVAIPDPEGGIGPALQFAVGDIAGGVTRTLTYRVRIGPGALQGTGINRAQAQAPGPPPLASNMAVCSVRLNQGVFTDKAIIIGKVFVDLNNNDIQDKGEPGIPGVRLYLQDGTYVITDSEGKYSIYGLDPRTYVVKVDETTLPPGCKMRPLTSRHHRNGVLCIADLKRGELRKVNFADESDDPKVLEDITLRRHQMEGTAGEITTSIQREMTVDGTSPMPGADTRGRAASGLIDSSGNTNVASVLYQSIMEPRTLNARNSNLPPAPVMRVPRVDLEKSVENTNNSLDILDLHDGDTLPVAQANIRVKGPRGTRFALKVNGTMISPRSVGKKVERADLNLEAWEYIGVDLKSGPNTIEVQQLDPFGNIRGTKAIKVIAPDKLGKIQLRLSNPEPIADGLTPVTVTVMLTDAKGVPVTARTPVTLETTQGRWDVEDRNQKEDGVQVFVENGRGEFKLVPPREPGTGKLHVTSGVLEAEMEVGFLPELRPMVAAGLLETQLRFNKLNLNALSPARKDDGFEQEIHNLSFSGNNGQLNGAGRAALFLKGKVKGDYLLTLAYDSDKDTKERLFRDIQPDEFYPVYGDSSVRGFDAQSTGRLYVRLDKKRSYLLYGDYTTGSTSEARGLGNYQRSLNGIKEHYENSRVNFNAWAAFDSSSQVVQEFPADGTSGPYFFSSKSGLINSERVEILTRDRNQPSLILNIVSLSRFSDYEFDPFSGRLLFRAPIPSMDSNLNPNSIRVTYEADQGGEKFWVAGADGQVKLTSRLELGGSTVFDQNPLNHYQMHSLNTTLKLADRTFLMAEVARSQSDLHGTADGERIELRHNSEKLDFRAYASTIATNFDNPSSIISAGRTEAGFKGSYRFAPQTRLLSEAVYTEDQINNGTRYGVLTGIEQTFPNKIRLQLRTRYTKETAAPSSANTVGATPNEVTTVGAKIASPVPWVPQANVSAEYENDISHIERRMISVGGDYQTANRTRMYARHELIDSVGGPYELTSQGTRNTTVFGVETEYMKDGQLFNEYRARDAIGGREAEASIGLRNLWKIDDGFRVNTTFERVSPILGTNLQNMATAATIGFEYTRPEDWKMTGRFEIRVADTEDRYLTSFGYTRKLSSDWTLLARNILFITEQTTGGENVEDRFQLGAAWRQTAVDVWNALFRYEYRNQYNNTDPTLPVNRQVHIFSTHVNWQPQPQLTISGRYAAKLALEDWSGASYINSAHLIATRVSHDITKRWSVGVNTSTLFSGEGTGIQYGFGPEVGYLVGDNLLVSVGYNITGFYDQDFSECSYTQKGFWLGMRLQFDEHIFDGFGKSRNKK